VVEDLPRSGRSSTSSTEVNIAKVKEMVTENRHLSLREIAAELSVSHESIRTILNDCLGMKHCRSSSSARPEFSSKTQSRKGR
jgi:DNA-directed RNA polymerase sigma subunit (sigma70/sigma32)